MKIKPVFKNVTKGRIQIIQQGIPLWLNPGESITGERYRVYVSMGLEEVGRLPKDVPIAPVASILPLIVIDDVIPSSSPISLRASIDPEVKVVNIELDDDVLPMDSLNFGGEDLKQAIVDDIEYDGIVILDDEDTDEELEDIYIIEDEEPEPVVDNYPHKCPEEDCDRAFASKRGLKSHSRIHKS